jgi:hypothetical protein
METTGLAWKGRGMTDKATLLQLASRCEAASGPDRELDGEVFRAIGMPLPGDFGGRDISLHWNEAEQCFLAPVGDMRVRYEQPRYTASVDSALGLLDGLARKPHWSVSWPVAEVELVFSGGPVVNATAATPALALCAAALRARAALA